VLSKAARDRGISAVFTSTTTVGLLHGTVEETDPGYKRQPARLGPPNDGSRTSTMDVSFPAYRVGVTTPVTGWALYDGDVLLATGEIEPRWPRAGDVIEILAGNVEVLIP
jgi:hypothetical protein